MVPTLLHEGQQRRHRYKEQTFKPRVNILFVNCLNPKCGHSATWPFTCFLSFNLLFFSKRCQSYMKPQNLTNDSEFLFMELQMIQTFSLCSLSCSCPHTWSPCWGIYSSFWLSRLTPISTLPCTSSILGWHRFHLHHNLENDSGHSDSQRVISYAGCLTQMSFFMLFGCLDGLLLIVMAYDQFIAICHPLHYLDIMTHVSVARWFWYHFSSVSWFPRCTIPWW